LFGLLTSLASASFACRIGTLPSTLCDSDEVFYLTVNIESTDITCYPDCLADSNMEGGFLCTSEPTFAPTQGPTPTPPPVAAITGFVVCGIVISLCCCYCIGLYKVRGSSTMRGGARFAALDHSARIGEEVFSAIALQTRAQFMEQQDQDSVEDDQTLA
jgi:hypothetical protein